MLKAETFRWGPRLGTTLARRTLVRVEPIRGRGICIRRGGARRRLGADGCLGRNQESARLRSLSRAGADGGALVGGGHIIIKRFGPLGGIGYMARGPLMAGVFSSRILRFSTRSNGSPSAARAPSDRSAA